MMMHVPLVGFLVTLIVVQSPPEVPSATEPPRATHTAQQLRRGLLQTADKIKSLHVVYRCDGYDPKRAPEGAYLYREVVAKSPSSLHSVSAHGHATMAWQDDPLQ
jgi:hypothetical protein